MKRFLLTMCLLVLAGAWFHFGRRKEVVMEPSFLASEAELTERYGPGIEGLWRPPAENTLAYRAGPLVLLASFWNGRAEKVTLAKQNQEAFTPTEQEQILAGWGGGWEPGRPIAGYERDTEWRRPDAWARTLGTAMVVRTLKFSEAEVAARLANEPPNE